MTKFVVIEDPFVTCPSEPQQRTEWWLHRLKQDVFEVRCRRHGSTSAGWPLATIGPSGITVWGGIPRTEELGIALTNEDTRLARV